MNPIARCGMRPMTYNKAPRRVAGSLLFTRMRSWRRIEKCWEAFTQTHSLLIHRVYVLCLIPSSAGRSLPRAKRPAPQLQLIRQTNADALRHESVQSACVDDCQMLDLPW